jgi:hypothetical protein
VYRVDVDFTNAFNAMSQAALWAVMRAYGISDVDLLVSLYEHSTVRMAPNDPQCATITFDTGVAQGSALSPLLFLIFMNALLGLITDKRTEIAHITWAPMRSAAAQEGGEPSNRTRRECSPVQPYWLRRRLVTICTDSRRGTSALRGNPGV